MVFGEKKEEKDYLEINVQALFTKCSNSTRDGGRGWAELRNLPLFLCAIRQKLENNLNNVLCFKPLP